MWPKKTGPSISQQSQYTVLVILNRNHIGDYTLNPALINKDKLSSAHKAGRRRLKIPL